uniref:AAA+ ATPase domain-containing protein n=1 Tax=Chlamydomonas leiostraca TaxID=1034604 RepID=A0A7S0R4R6_9CHLO|mmetsp:Transcript_13951/g.34367  ORF Transcript_13951/g.34367 Transcript_13951/m.34367 type:complete len:626 (+) Transcript_13951:80-1957(+)
MSPEPRLARLCLDAMTGRSKQCASAISALLPHSLLPSSTSLPGSQGGHAGAMASSKCSTATAQATPRTWGQQSPCASFGDRAAPGWGFSHAHKPSSLLPMHLQTRVYSTPSAPGGSGSDSGSAGASGPSSTSSGAGQAGSVASTSSAASTAGAPLLRPGEALAKLTPAAVVERLDRFIIGQGDAKKAVAVAFRNRWRRQRVAGELREEITPKNILMIGPTGCGKTEIARRLAKLADAPFIKVEATKFTEVGYHGRDVDSIIKDLVEAAIGLVKSRLREQAQAAIALAVEHTILRQLASSGMAGPEGAVAAAQWAAAPGFPTTPVPKALEGLRARLAAGELEGAIVEVELPAKPGLDLGNMMQGQQSPLVISLDRLMAGARKVDRKRLTVKEARAALDDAEVERLFPAEVVAKEAVRLTEQDGIVFIDEIDKIVNSRNSPWRTGDPSSQGVQRDLLPIIEGSAVQTKHGTVNTDHILFICSGAFHSAKPGDLMAELQGRLPIRVELKALTQDDFYRILTEPQYNLIKQQQMLLATEGVDLHFTDAAVREVARLAEALNRATENIGARRLAAVLERVVESVSFGAPELVKQARAEGRERYACVVDKEHVSERVAVVMQRQDLSKWII